MGLIYSYLDTIDVDDCERKKILDYLEFVNARATGTSSSVPYLSSSLRFLLLQVP